MMEALSTDDIAANLMTALLFTVIALIANWIAYLQKYYHLPYLNTDGPDVRLKDVFWTYGLFLFVIFLVAPTIFSLLVQYTALSPYSIMTPVTLQLVVFFFSFLFLLIYDLIRDPTLFRRVFKDWKFPGARSLQNDFWVALIGFIVAIFSAIAAASYFDIFSTLIYGPSDHDQVAIRYLKFAMANPISLTGALFTILIGAPFLEEYLFRGVLMSWLRSKLGSIKAIFISAILFAFFHYAPSQFGLNLPIIATLFTFGCYLGFIYEKTRSLFASIFLHVTFNLVSVIRIIFNGE